MALEAPNSNQACLWRANLWILVSLARPSMLKQRIARRKHYRLNNSQNQRKIQVKRRYRAWRTAKRLRLMYRRENRLGREQPRVATRKPKLRTEKSKSNSMWSGMYAMNAQEDLTRCSSASYAGQSGPSFPKCLSIWMCIREKKRRLISNKCRELNQNQA